MTDLNVEDFFKDVAKALDILYRSFPIPTTVYVEDICGADEPDEFGLHSKRYVGCFNTLLWLQAEGYIRFVEPIKQEAVDQAVLSSRCFTLLSTPEAAGYPSAFDAQADAHIEHLRRALRERASSALRQAVMTFLHQWHRDEN